MSRDSESESDPCSMPPSKTSNRCWKNEHYPRASWRHKLLLLKISSRNFVSKRDWELEPASKWKWDIELTSLLFDGEKEEKWILPGKQNSILRKPDQITDTSISALTFAMLLVRKTSESIPKKVEKVSKAPSVTSSANLHTICLLMLGCVFINKRNSYGNSKTR